MNILVPDEITRIEAQWPRIEAHLVDERHINRRIDTVSQWGVGQQLLHLLRVIGGISGGIERMLNSSGAAPPNTTSEFKREVLLHGIPRGVGDAPQMVRVDTPPSLDEVRRGLDEAQTAWRRIAARPADLQASEHTFPHHRLGPMNPAEWLRFIAHHNHLHLAIIDDIVEATDAPQPAPEEPV